MGIQLFRSLACVAILAVSGPALADVDIKRADALFAEGIALRDTNLEQSCKKFEESLTYNPQAIGTILNVALCDEKLGRIASAVERFSDARDRAKEQQLEDHLKAAEEHLALLVPELPHLSIKFVEPPIADTKVLVDDKVIAIEKISRFPVDPGERIIVVSAPGRLPHQTKIVINKREQKEIEIPALAKSVNVTVKSSRKTIGRITTAVGVAAFGTGLGLGLYARSQYNAQFPDNCDRTKLNCNPIGQPKIESARTLATVGTVVGVVGVAAAGAGLLLWLSAPKESAERKVSVVPHIAPHEAVVFAVATF